jgi:hypothetical protein
MSRSTDPGHFFQTDASESTRARRAAKAGNKNGNPVVLPSKILNVIPDPFSSSCIYVAESAGCIRRVNVEVGMKLYLKTVAEANELQTKDTKTVYRGPMAPVTSVAIGGATASMVFAGCWDKDIWSWDRDTRSPARKFKGHSDFVKAIICAKIGGKDVSLSIANQTAGLISLVSHIRRC